jgi:uncharacterized protein (DUF1800 family)
VSDTGVHKLEAGNRVIPELRLSSLGLDPVSEPLDRAAAKHLLERSLFGARFSEINQFTGLSITQALDILLADLPVPDPPVNVSTKDTQVPLGETWVNAPHFGDANFVRRKSLRDWWVGQMIDQPTSLREKMVLFWHNHFVTEMPAVGRSKYNWDYVNILWRNALGNFRSFTEQITVSTAMLRYLNGDQNKLGSPNENYARELFELFTIGKGPLAGEGDYTYYTEQDIQEAARVLTGWRINNTTQVSYFDTYRHDHKTKNFSDYFDNTRIGTEREDEYKTLIAIILGKKETARRLARKLYRWFVYYIIDEFVETNVIEPLATTIYENGYELKPALRQLLSSQHFFDPAYRACYIKNPYEHIVGTLRKLELEFPIGCG